MARQAEKSEEHHWPLVVEPATLRALALEMQNLLAAPGTDPDTIGLNVAVFYSDGFRQGFTSVEDVISLENPAWCSISGLLLVAETRSAMISCQLGPGGAGASVRVAGPVRERVYECCRRMEERIRSMSRSMPPRVYMSPSLAVFAAMTSACSEHSSGLDQARQGRPRRQHSFSQSSPCSPSLHTVSCAGFSFTRSCFALATASDDTIL